MADIIGSYERLPNDAVRAAAVAKRREYMCIYIYMLKIFLKKQQRARMQKPPQTGELLPFDLQDILFFLWFKIRPAESPQPCLNQFHENGNCRDLQRV